MGIERGREMKELKKKFESLKVEFFVFDGVEGLGVNARLLWEFLGSKTDFSTWFKKRTERLELVEEKDFLIFLQTEENSQGGRGRPKIDYVVTLNQAKHLAQIEQTDVGRDVRQYLIDSETELQRVLRSRVNRVVSSLDTAILEQRKLYELLKEGFKNVRYIKGKPLTAEEKAKIAVSISDMTGFRIPGFASAFVTVNASVSPSGLLQPCGSLALPEGKSKKVREDYYVNPEDLGKWFKAFVDDPPHIRAQKANKVLEKYKLQRKVGDRWEPTALATKHDLYVAKPYQAENTHSSIQYLWWARKTMQFLANAKGVPYEEIVWKGIEQLPPLMIAEKAESKPKAEKETAKAEVIK